MLKALNKQRGITLIALIITIIVLLILAGVTIAQIMGNESAMNKAVEAKQKQEEGAFEDKLKLTVSSSIDLDGKFNLEEISNSITADDSSIKTSLYESEEEGGDVFLAVYNENTEQLYTVDKQGNVDEFRYDIYVYINYVESTEKYNLQVHVPLNNMYIISDCIDYVNANLQYDVSPNRKSKTIKTTKYYTGFKAGGPTIKTKQLYGTDGVIIATLKGIPTNIEDWVISANIIVNDFLADLYGTNSIPTKTLRYNIITDVPLSSSVYDLIH